MYRKRKITKNLPYNDPYPSKISSTDKEPPPTTTLGLEKEIQAKIASPRAHYITTDKLLQA